MPGQERPPMRVRSFSILETEANPECALLPGAIIRARTWGGSAILDEIVSIQGSVIITKHFTLELP